MIIQTNILMFVCFLRGDFIKRILDIKYILKYLIFIFSSLILIFIDQLSKIIVTKHLANGQKIIVIPEIFEIFYIENRGAAFGILQGQQKLFFILTIVVLIILFIYLYKIPLNKKYMPLYIVMIMIFSGAIGNFIDRLNKGYVVDFLYFKPINFPLFNVADSYITIACFMLLYLLLFHYKEDELKF